MNIFAGFSSLVNLELVRLILVSSQCILLCLAMDNLHDNNYSMSCYIILLTFVGGKHNQIWKYIYKLLSPSHKPLFIKPGKYYSIKLNRFKKEKFYSFISIYEAKQPDPQWPHVFE